MCNRLNRLELCTCSDMSVERIQQIYSDEIKSLGKKDILKVISWKLKKYLELDFQITKEVIMDGLMIMPSENLIENLPEKFILNQLNTHNCFDFDYKPIEGDNLIFEIGWLFNRWKKSISKKKIQYKYSSYIFRNGKWVADSYNSFYEKTEIFNQGILKMLHSNDYK